MAKRGKLEIMKDILNIIKENKSTIKPTPLLRKSGLSSSSFKEYYAALLEKELIKETTDKNERQVMLTEKGFRFIEKYKTIMSFIDEFEL